MRRTAVGFLAFVLVTGMSLAAEVQEPVIMVAVYDRAEMKPETLLSAEQEAGRVMNSAGVSLHWLNCQTARDGDDCLSAMNQETLSVTLLAKSPHPALKSEEMGYALQDRNGRGSQCYIFRRRVDDIAAFAHVSTGRLLGAAIAHELGHLLKGLDSHSPEGVMSAHWHEREIQAVRRGALTFTKADNEQIQKRLNQNSSASLKMDRLTAQ